MKLYNLSLREIMKLNKEFTKTQFGMRARIFSFVPYIIFVIYLIIAILGNEYNATNFLLILVGSSITQLQYGNMLKDYINSKE